MAKFPPINGRVTILSVYFYCTFHHVRLVICYEAGASIGMMLNYVLSSEFFGRVPQKNGLNYTHEHVAMSGPVPCLSPKAMQCNNDITSFTNTAMPIFGTQLPRTHMSVK